MKLPVMHYNPITSIRRLLSPKPPTTLAVHDGAVDCPQAVDGVGQLERCMSCDRLVVLQVDAEGDGTITCRPDLEAVRAEQG